MLNGPKFAKKLETLNSYTFLCRCSHWCNQPVTRMVSCEVQNGTEPIRVKKWRSCFRWPYSYPCASYVTEWRPRYVKTFKAVRELVWKCCSGYSGINCLMGDKAQYYSFKSCENKMHRPSLPPILARISYPNLQQSINIKSKILGVV